MHEVLSRRSLLAGMGSAALYGVGMGPLVSMVDAQEAAQPAAGAANICLNMVFMGGRRAKFDAKKYADRHVPLLRRVYGDSVERIELRTVAGMVQGVPSPLLAAATLWIRDPRAFSEKLQAAHDDITKDLDSISSGDRIAQVEQIIGQIGEARDQLPANSQVISVYYPASATATFDRNYYLDQYLPKQYALYGTGAVRRIEVSYAARELGNNSPQLLVASHLYIRDRSAYDQASRAAFQELMRDNEKFTNISDMYWVDMRVTAVG